MARLALVLLLFLAVLLAALALSRSAQAASKTVEVGRLPETVKTVSYILLILLMFGVVTGWLGGL